MRRLSEPSSAYIPQPDWTESRDLIVRLLDVIASLTATHSPPTTAPTER